MINILFVCTGNTCRSPMAAALLKEKTKGLNVQSAGIAVFYEGSPANEQAIQVLAEKGISGDHYTKSLSTDLVEWADLILTMTEQHKKSVLIDYPTEKGKIHTLKQFVSDSEMDKLSSVDISDPFGGTLEHYRQTLAELDHFVNKLADKLSNCKK